MDVGGGGFSTEDVLIEILKRLPVKSLIRFMCISKPWNHLINDPFLVTFHLQFNKQSSSSSNPHSHSILGITIYGDRMFEHFRIDKTQKTTLEHLNIQFPWKLKLYPKPQPREHWESVGIIGHCNGVICARDSQRYEVLDFTTSTGRPIFKTVRIERYVICNPITRRFHILPESDFTVPDLTFEEPEDEFTREAFRKSRIEKSRASGFGFIDDVAYKVVMVSCGMAQVNFSYSRRYIAHEPPWIEVYDSRSGSWRRVGVDHAFSYEYLCGGEYNSSDKCLYWFGRGYGKKKCYFTLVSFDLVEEKWEETLLPYKSRNGYDYEDGDLEKDDDHKDDVFGKYGVCQGIDVVGESVVMFVGDQRNKLVHSLWKMNKEEDKVSWTHMYRLNYQGSECGFCRDGELLLWMRDGNGFDAGENLVMHDPNRMNDACFGFTDLEFKVGIIAPDFVESLVLLDGEREVIEDASEEISPYSEEPTKRVVEEAEVYEIGSLFCQTL